MSNPLPSPDCPDSSSSSPPLCRPFSFLPTELVQYIIESTIPPYYHSTTYFQRKGTLLSLSRVSRLFRQIVQPLLFAVVHFKKQGNINHWNWCTHERTDLRCPIELVVEFSTIVGGFHESIIQLPSLQLLALDAVKDELDLSLLTPLVNLRTLRLSSLQATNPRNIQLPSVTELQLFTSDSLDLKDVLSPNTFPDLRTLAYSDNYYGPDWDICRLLAQMAPQLDVLSVDADLIPKLSPETLQAIDDLTLYDLAAGTTDIPNVRNMRVMVEYDATYLVDTLEMLAANSCPPRRLLYLPHHSQIELSEEVEAALQQLSATCQEKQAEEEGKGRTRRSVDEEKGANGNR
ncbi:hypothetical protein JCM5353_003255 [Sporobolomyces roseus]